MLNIINIIVPTQIKGLVKDITASQGGQWVEKKELRQNEANKINSSEFNPKASRTRSF
ncbi:MAG: hypothetical protein WAU01_14840 [Saprospiraceae bacterium]